MSKDWLLTGSWDRSAKLWSLQPQKKARTGERASEGRAEGRAVHLRVCNGGKKTGGLGVFFSGGDGVKSE